MNDKTPSNTEILSWEIEDMEAYWALSQHYDQRPFDTISVMGGAFNQRQSEQSFARILDQLGTPI